MKSENLTTEQVNNNLKNYFKNQKITCLGFINGSYILKARLKIFIDEKKQVYVKPDIDYAKQYYKHLSEFGGIKIKKRFIDETGEVYNCIPYFFNMRSFDNVSFKYNTRLQTELKNNLLTSVGYLKPKDEGKTDLQRLQEFKIPAYVQFYKLIKEVTVLNAEVKKDQVYAGYGKYVEGLEKLHITHKTGSFSFPIENIDQQHITKQIRAIFFNLVGIAQETEIKPELSHIMYVSGNGTIKAKKAIGRLLKHKVAA